MSSVQPLFATNATTVDHSDVMNAVSQQTIKRHLDWLAADERMGRDTPSKELNESAEYIAQCMETLGLVAPKSGYLHDYTVSRTDLDTSNTWCEIQGKRLKLGSEFVPLLRTSEGRVQNAPLMFIGFGINSEEYDYNDYQGLNVQGAIVVCVAGEPDFITDLNSEGQRRKRQSWYSYTQTKIAEAAEQGAAAIVILRSTDHKGWSRSFLPRWPSLMGIDMSRSKVQLDIASQPKVPAFTGNTTLVDALFGSMEQLDSAISSWNQGVRHTEIPSNPNLSCNIEFVREKHTVSNVVAMVPGTTKKSRYVVIGAHYDHVGYTTPQIAPGAPIEEVIDSVYNGADDNASGTAAVMAIAEAFATSKLQCERTVVFVWFSGEEKGLYGSRAFVENCPIPRDSIDAMLNIDMVGRNHPDSLSIGGALRCAELTIENERTNSMMAEPFVLSYDIESYFFRSDQANFARYDIPVLFYFSREHEDYHQPGDEIHKIDYGKATRAAKMCAGTLMSVANAKERFPYTPQPSDVRFKTR